MNADPHTASALFTALIPELDAPDAPESNPWAQPDRALELSQNLGEGMGELLAIEDGKPPEDRFFGPKKHEQLKALAVSLPKLAMAFYGAHLALLASEAPTDPHRVERSELAPKVREADEELFPRLWLKLRKQKGPRAILVAVRKGSGHKDDGEDALVEVSLAREHGIEGHWGTPEVLTQVEKDATRLLELLRKLPAAVHLARVRRNRMWARLVAAFNELRLAALALSGGDEERFGGMSRG